MDEDSFWDNETHTTIADTSETASAHDLSSTTEYSTQFTTALVKNITNVAKKTVCETVLSHEGNLYICLEKVSLNLFYQLLKCF